MRKTKLHFFCMAVFLECVFICTAASCICVYLSLAICKLMVTTNRSSSCAMNVLLPRKLLKKLVKYALINRVMQQNRKVGQADESDSQLLKITLETPSF